MIKHKINSSMFNYEAGLTQGRTEQKKRDIESIEEFAKRFHLDPLIINKLILGIKNCEIE